jgi:hypothetical protein
MNPEVSAAVLLSLATIVAALIAAVMSYISLTASKEQKVSDFRQAWIEGLRDDLSKFLACARAFARASQELAASGGERGPLSISGDDVSRLRYEAAELRYRIGLRLNHQEAEHVELMRMVNVAIEAQNDTPTGNGDAASTLDAIDRVAEFAPGILKKEWERVKAGEKSFQNARTVVPLVALAVALVVLLILLLRGG